MDSQAVHPRVREIATDVAEMEVRGAASIADAVAEGLRVQATESDAATPAAFRAEMRAAARHLLDTRPTAVSLPNALRFVLEGMAGETVPELRASAVAAAEALQARLDAAHEELGEIGAGRLADGDAIMTHCHSTDALACVEAAVAAGRSLSAVVKETRPRQQGHITARALSDLGVDVTLIVDGAAYSYLDQVDHVLVGADSVRADGSVVNKIGTSGLAVLARERGVPLTVAAQTIKLDPGSLRGEPVDIEQRDPAEVLPPAQRDGLADVTVANPAFDVTPPERIDAIVTEQGAFDPSAIGSLVQELYGDVHADPWAA
jgi:ribose 1,5-bisphosphate isomerase